MTNPRLYSYTEITEPRPDPVYAIESFIMERSVNLFYGYPGSLKSLLALDVSFALATGKYFLPAMPGSGHTNNGLRAIKVPVLWIDFDNGIDVSFERESAMGKSYGATAVTPFYHISMPDWKGVNPKSILEMISYLKETGINPKVIVIDTLLRFASVKDENSSEMDTVMKAMRYISEQLQAVIILISHSNKYNNGRPGNGLRGHSSIEGGVDSLFMVKREGNSDIITIEHQKARRKPLDPFCARWTYEHKAGNNDILDQARFYFEPYVSKENSKEVKQAQREIDILKTLAENGGLAKANIADSIHMNRNACYEILQKLEQESAILSKRNPINKAWTVYEITDLGRKLI